MALSDTALRVLTKAVQHPLRLAAPPQKIPAAACRAVLSRCWRAQCCVRGRGAR